MGGVSVLQGKRQSSPGQIIRSLNRPDLNLLRFWLGEPDKIISVEKNIVRSKNFLDNTSEWDDNVVIFEKRSF